MNRIARLSLCLLAAFAARPAFAQDDVLIVAGAGVVGQWDTEFDIANVSPDPIEVELAIEGLPLGVPCPPNCTSQVYPLPGRGNAARSGQRIHRSGVPGPAAGHDRGARRGAPSGRPCPVRQLGERVPVRGAAGRQGVLDP